MWLKSIFVSLFLFIICTAKYVDEVEDNLMDGTLTSIPNNGLRRYMLMNVYNANQNRKKNAKIHRYNGNDVQIILLGDKLNTKENTENDESTSNENKKVMNNNKNLYSSHSKYFKYNKFHTMSNLIPSLISILKTKGTAAVLEIIPLNIKNPLDIKRMSKEIYDLKRDLKFYQYHLPKRFTVKQNSDDENLYNNQDKNEYYIVLLNNIWKLWPFNIQSLFENIQEPAEDDTSIVRERNNGNKAILRDICEHCIKAQVNKCYKAIKDVPKRSCEIYYCKSDFKKKFKSKSKTVCMEEFWGRKGKNKRHRNTTVINKNNHSIRDMTRVGFDCDGGVYNLKKFERKQKGHAAGVLDGSKLNVLREKHERACQKALSKKCIKACENVIELTCDSFKCKHGHKKSMKKDCKKACKRVFIKSKSSESKESSKSSEEKSDEEESTGSE